MTAGQISVKFKSSMKSLEGLKNGPFHVKSNFFKNVSKY
jgi:hypothetical protein